MNSMRAGQLDCDWKPIWRSVVAQPAVTGGDVDAGGVIFSSSASPDRPARLPLLGAI
jgi:hypothetical protein